MKADKEPVRLRGHQLTDFFYFHVERLDTKKADRFFNKMIKVYGYDQEFTQKYREFHESLKDDALVRIVDKRGSICELGCPHKRPGQSCYSKNKKQCATYSAAYVSNLDRDTAASCGVEIGKVYTVKELRDLLKDKKKILLSG